MLSETIQMQTYVVTASRKRERVKMPGSDQCDNSNGYSPESNTNLGDYMKTVKGVEFTQSGIEAII
ncbi:MAG: hypothetical protein CM1200mP10_28540 [Candidatus Neomarinimicrobiota bacterium]|nr:MAG: hypothetical protein CM1200mP10_28540 [Candidatus Neomarinimicrobiota bacterium]